ncbi:hypothetical protein TWF694_001139 [Orbilia ellipsospora]|uniref:BAG domain-containing protein n=1 Tax=Orbilia ellipsospora TaxID=2528407 RepID=A0AAV9XR59_9PEZI
MFSCPTLPERRNVGLDIPVVELDSQRVRNNSSPLLGPTKGWTVSVDAWAKPISQRPRLPPAVNWPVRSTSIATRTNNHSIRAPSHGIKQDKLASKDLWEALLPTRLASLLDSHLTPISDHFSSQISFIRSHLPPSIADTTSPNVLVLLIILILTFIPLSLLTFPMRRFLKDITGSSFFDDDESRTEDKILVQHARDTLNITFPKGDISASKTTIKDLRISVQDALGFSHDHSIKLVFAGHNLKVDEEPLSKYNLKHGAKVLCMASKSKLAAPPSSSGSRTPVPRATPEPAKKIVIPPLEKIQLVRKHITGTVLPLVEAFEKDPPQDEGKRKEEHHRLGETVLGEMLKLDSVDVDGEDGPEVRKRRKEMVKELHGLLERLDKVDKP